MLSDKLIRLIEDNAEKLTARWVEEVKSNPLTAGYGRFSNVELHDKVIDTYRQLGHWIENPEVNETLSAHYTRIGRSRANENFKLSEVVFATILAKKHLLQYINAQGFFFDTIGLRTQVEFHNRIHSFFDRAVFFICIGFEHAHEKEEHFYSPGGALDKAAEAFANWFIKKK